MLHAHFPFSSRSSLTCVNRRPWHCHCYPENPNSGWPNNFGNGIVMIIWLTLSLTEKNVWITNIKFIYLRIRSHYSSHLQGIPHHPIVLYTWKSLSIWTVNCDVKRGIIFFWCFCMNDDSKHWNPCLHKTLLTPLTVTDLLRLLWSLRQHLWQKLESYLVGTWWPQVLRWNLKNIRSITVTVLVHVSAQQVVCSSSSDRGESKRSVANTESA